MASRVIIAQTQGGGYTLGLREGVMGESWTPYPANQGPMVLSEALDLSQRKGITLEVSSGAARQLLEEVLPLLRPIGGDEVTS